MINLAIVSIIVFVINLPFGYWRGAQKKLSVKWFLAIHIPIPAVIGLRHLFDIGFAWHTYPFILGSYILSQHIGDRYRKKKMLSN